MYLTIALPLSVLALLLVIGKVGETFSLIPYLFFFIGPTLTYFGAIGVLTGFDGNGFGGLTFGITFYTVFIAYLLSKYSAVIRDKPILFILSVINPLYLFTGPIPSKIINSLKSVKIKRIYKRFCAVNADLILGIFFSSILAPTFIPYFYLKQSTEILDILLFGLIFEFYVYFNFAGFSMIAWSIMRIFGVQVLRNFRQPFGAVSVIDYWQRWHLSLSSILKELFFFKIKPIIGMFGAVIVVFFVSALWHGVSFNFICWGLFHAIIWRTAHYLHKRNFTTSNYILLAFGIIIGRIIFSELDAEFLLEKMKTVINFYEWNWGSKFEISKLGLREILNLTMALFVIILEVLLPHFGFSDRDYEHLKSSYISTFIAIYTCLAFVGFGGAPIYGNR